MAAVKVGKTGFNERVGAGVFDGGTLVNTDSRIDEARDVARVERGCACVILKGDLAFVRDVIDAVIAGRIFKVGQKLCVKAGGLAIEFVAGNSGPEGVIENAGGAEVLAFGPDTIVDTFGHIKRKAALKTVDVDVECGTGQRVIGVSGDLDLAQPGRILSAAPDVADEGGTVAV
jgi:hypothetical protein